MATLHMIYGKPCSGKSTLAGRLAQAPGTVLVSQDAWMAALYPDELIEIADYVRLIPRLRAAMGPHLSALLRAGVSVVMDWPANTAGSRAWMRQVFETAGADHRLHVLDISDDECRRRLAGRNASGEHEFTLTDEQFAEVVRHIQPVTLDEGFNTVRA